MSIKYILDLYLLFLQPDTVTSSVHTLTPHKQELNDILYLFAARTGVYSTLFYKVILTLPEEL